MPRESIVDKAARLVEEGAVTELPDARVFPVRSMGHIYRVILDGGQAFCTCPAGQLDKTCKHALAARHMAANS